MRILVAGPPKEAAEYRSWIMEELSAEIELLENFGHLGSTLGSGIWDLLILDYTNCDSRVEELVRSVKTTRPTLPVVVICGDTAQDAIEVMRLGVTDYLIKPVNKERLHASVQRILAVDHDNRSPEDAHESSFKKEENDFQPLPDEVIFEGSAKMAAVGQVVDKILDVDLPVLITGESGTGKEIVAKYIYGKSSRKGPFIKVNCAAIPSELLESELFGYERGAFTGAYRRKPGKFEAADGGVLFLDEISELSYPLQSKLLHVLQDGTVSTLGSTREVRVDVRIIVATNQDLQECVQRGSFRDDLFFRLNVVHINVPPLRERLKQLETLIDYFRNKFARQYNKTPVHLDDDAKNFLFNYRWPGNIRELENTIRRITVLGGENLRGHMNGLDQITVAQHPDQFPVHDNEADLPGTYPKDAYPPNSHFPADAALDQSSPKISGNDENAVFPNGL
ncbi:sigma-54 dependent transcriptional regulator, partial [bacterium]|nr:sigma-54 dependent transcriptional regulator [bacterium]